MGAHVRVSRSKSGEMSDPVENAVQRALDAEPGAEGYSYGDMECAASEMARPLRALLENWDVCHEAQEMSLLEAIAPLVFSTKELREIAQRAKQSGEWSYATRWVDTEAGHD